MQNSATNYPKLKPKDVGQTIFYTFWSDQLQILYSLKGIAGHRAYFSILFKKLSASLITEAVDFAESLLDRQRHTPIANLS